MAGGSKGSVAKRKGVDTAKPAIKMLADKIGLLTRQDVTCQICWSILIEPVTPPCGHSFCCTCFNIYISDTSLLCPCCRTRLSVWGRTALKQDNFIDNKLWERVKIEFPRLVRVRLLGEDSQDVLDDDLVSTFQNDNNNNNGPAGGDVEGDENVEFRCPLTSTGNGELNRELDDKMNRKHLEDIENERRIQESDSQKLIKQLQVESGRRSNIEEEQDRILAQQLENVDLNFSINAGRKLFSQLPESPGSSGIGGSTKSSPTKQQKNGRFTYSQTSSSSSPTQSSGSQSQNSILNCVSSSQKSNNGSPPLSQSSSVILLGSPKPSTSHRRPIPSKKQRSVTFDVVKVFYFPREQGFTSVPSQGGCTLGMTSQHVLFEKFSLQEYAAEQRHMHKLQPIPPRQRRIMLREAEVKKIDPAEKDQCQDIRSSRELGGCSCKLYCDPDTCSCALADIECQVERANFPCKGCTLEGCGNPNKRVEFSPERIRAHFIGTLKRLEKEDFSNQVVIG